MAKTIKEIAEEIGVTKPAIHQKRKKEPLKSSLQPFTETVNGTVYIEEDGVKLIKQAFSIPVDVSEAETVSVNLHEAVYSVVYTLQGELEAKNKQIDALQKSVNDLTQALEHAHDSLNKSQALHAGTIQSLLEVQSQNTPSKPPESPSEGSTGGSGVEARGEGKNRPTGFWRRFFQK